MTIEEQIAELLAKAEPLRLLPEDAKEAAGLPAMVDSINALRAKQANAPAVAAALPVVSEPAAAQVVAAPAAEPAKRGPGRPKKAE